MQRSRTVELLTEVGAEVVYAADSVLGLMDWMSMRSRSRWPHLLVVEVLGQRTASRDLDAVVALSGAGVKILLVSSFEPRRAAHRVVEAVADGVVSKTDGEAEFVRAVTAVLTGASIMTRNASTALRVSDDSPRLSAQEARTLELYASGLPMAEVAEIIGVRPDTARKYLGRVKEKYAAIGRPTRTRLELLSRAREDRLID